MRHSLPAIQKERSAHSWSLSDAGRARCRPLAEALAEYQPLTLVSSEESKAAETAGLVADHLQTTYHVAPGLHEQLREKTPFMEPAAWQQTMTDFFDRPNDLVFGQETAAQAQARFTEAATQVIAQHTQGNIAIFTHGTVMTLFTGAKSHIAPYAFWRQLGLPAFIVFALPDYQLQRVCATLPENDTIN